MRETQWGFKVRETPRKDNVKGAQTSLEKAQSGHQVAEKFAGLARPTLVWNCWASNRPPFHVRAGTDGVQGTGSAEAKAFTSDGLHVTGVGRGNESPRNLGLQVAVFRPHGGLVEESWMLTQARGLQSGRAMPSSGF